MNITLIRHSSVKVAPDIVYGVSDVPVSDTFEQEAAQVALSIKEQQFDAVYCSPLNRCRQLAAHCGFANPLIDKRLIEIDFGSWEMQAWNNILSSSSKLWFDDWINVRAGGGESFYEQYCRVAEFMDELKPKPFDNVCLFVHAGTIRCALIYAGIADFQNVFDQHIPYCNIRKITI